MEKKFLTAEQAAMKLKQFCAYQERCHQEVRQKLVQLGVRTVLHDAIIANLIEENYLNEERFAEQFAGGKFRMLGWGKRKITQALKQKQVSEYCIRKALRAIDEEQYEATLHNIAEKKYNSLRGSQYLVRKKKTADYLLQKGYESDLVREVIGSLSGEKS